MGNDTGDQQRVLIAHPGAELYGSDRVLIDAALGFRDAGWEARVVIPNDGPLRQVLTDAGVDVVIKETLVLRKSLMKPTGWATLVSGVVGGRRAISRMIRDFDPHLLYVSTITQPLWLPVARAAGVATMLHVHEAEASASGIVRKVLYWPARSADAIVVNSDFARRTMLASYPSLGDRSRIVWNAVPGPDELIAPRPRLDGALRVVYIGRLSPRKGVDLIVEALGILDIEGVAAELDIVGAAFEGYEWFETELKAAAARHGVEKRVRFHGFQDSVWKAVSAADVVVVPSRGDEPFGNTAVEAVLALRPVIVSDTSGLREATRDVPTAVRVTPGSAEAIAEALARTAENWAGVVAHVDEAAVIVRARHDVTAFRHALVSAADTVVAGHATRRR